MIQIELLNQWTFESVNLGIYSTFESESVNFESDSVNFESNWSFASKSTFEFYWTFKDLPFEWNLTFELAFFYQINFWIKLNWLVNPNFESKILLFATKGKRKESLDNFWGSFGLFDWWRETLESDYLASLLSGIWLYNSNLLLLNLQSVFFTELQQQKFCEVQSKKIDLIWHWHWVTQLIFIMTLNLYLHFVANNSL